MFAEYDDNYRKIHVYFDEDDHICTMSDMLKCIFDDCDLKDVDSDGEMFGVVLFGGNDYTYCPIETCDGVQFRVDWNDLNMLNENREVVISA